VLARRSTQVVDRLVVGDRQQPGTRCRVRSQPGIGAQRGEERFLEAVLGSVDADHRAQGAPDVLAVALKQILEGRETVGHSV
jgi:hypothetical protein